MRHVFLVDAGLIDSMLRIFPEFRKPLAARQVSDEVIRRNSLAIDPKPHHVALENAGFFKVRNESRLAEERQAVNSIDQNVSVPKRIRGVFFFRNTESVEPIPRLNAPVVEIID